MFRALLAHPQEALYKRHLVYCVRVISVGCYQDWSGTPRGVYHHTPPRDNVTAPHERPNVRSRLHFGPNRKGSPRSPSGTCGGMEGGGTQPLTFKYVNNKMG
jgi:hypothetical protein